jgi:S1-C subfamily serine protease
VAIEDSFDLIYEVTRHQLGDATDLDVKRGEETVTLDIVFKELPDTPHE